MLKRLVLILGLSSLSAGLLSVLPAATPAADADSAAWPSLLQGSLPSALTATEVDAFVVPPSRDDEQVGSSHMIEPIAAVLSTTGPDFSVLVDPLAIASDLRRPDGIVDFALFVRDAAGTSWTTFTSARAGALSTTLDRRSRRSEADYDYVWVSVMSTMEDVSGVETDAGYPVLDPQAARDTSSSREKARLVIGGPENYDDEVVDINPWEFAQAEVPAMPATGQDCLEEHYKGDVNVSTTIGTSYPIGTSTSRMVHTNSSSNSSELGVAMGYESSSGTGITWKQSGSRTTGGSWTGAWASSGAKRSYRIVTNYHKYILGEGCNGAVRYRRPHIETGGASTNTNGLTRPDWNTYCSLQPRNFTFTREDSEGNAYSYGAAVKFAKFIGIDLSIKKNYTTKNQLEYVFTGDVRHQLCGNNDYPSVAGKMVDRFA